MPAKTLKLERTAAAGRLAAGARTMRQYAWIVPVGLLLSACATAGRVAPPSPGSPPAPAAPRQTGNDLGSGCSDDGDCASPLYCSSITSTCEPTPLWCDASIDCQQATGDPGSRCIGNACWGTGVACRSFSCLQGNGCANDADCDPGWTCSTGNGVCYTQQQPPSQQCSNGLVWNASYGDGGGCVAPASWPPATSQCQEDAQAPPTCLLCSTNIYETGLRCPDGYGYLYGYMGHFWCCLDPPY